MITPTPITPQTLGTIADLSPEVRQAWHNCTSDQQTLLLYILQGIQPPEAYRLAYNYPPDTDRKILRYAAAAALKRSSIAKVWAALTVTREVDLLRVTEVLHDALEANKSIKDGEETIKVPDWPIRLRAVELITKLQGLNMPDKQEIEVRSTVIRYHRPERDQVDLVGHQVIEPSSALEEAIDTKIAANLDSNTSITADIEQ